jgi:hypothetical protein
MYHFRSPGEIGTGDSPQVGHLFDADDEENESCILRTVVDRTNSPKRAAIMRFRNLCYSPIHIEVRNHFEVPRVISQDVKAVM